MLQIKAAVIHVFSMPHIAVAAFGHVPSLLHITAAVSRHGMQLYWQRLCASINRHLRTVEISMLLVHASLCVACSNALLHTCML
jgi:hypothetical protein